MRHGPVGRRRMSKPAGMHLARQLLRERRVVDQRPALPPDRRRRPVRLPRRPRNRTRDSRHVSFRLAKRTRPLPRDPPPPSASSSSKPQPFEHARRQRLILLAQNVQHHADPEARARGNAFQRPRIRLRRDAVDGVLALHFGDFVVEILAHLRRDALRIERRIVDGQPRRAGRAAIPALRLPRAPCARDCGRTAGRFRRRDGRSDGCELPGRGAWKDRPARRATSGPARSPAASAACRAASCPECKAGRRRPSPRDYPRRRFRATLCPRRCAGRFRNAGRPTESASRPTSILSERYVCS